MEHFRSHIEGFRWHTEGFRWHTEHDFRWHIEHDFRWHGEDFHFESEHMSSISDVDAVCKDFWV